MSKFTTSELRKQANAVHLFPKVSRSKGNQIMKFGQLIDCNMRNIFLEKSCAKFCGETIPRPFSKKSKLSKTLKTLKLKFYTVCFCCMPS